jgi:hypothetical protein
MKITPLAGLRAGALLISGDNFYNIQSVKLGALGLRPPGPVAWSARHQCGDNFRRATL